MEVGSLALRYVPFLAMMGVGLLLALDARVRIKRPGSPHWAPGLQVLLALAVVVIAMVALIVSPDVGLLEATADRPLFELTILAFAIAAVAAVGTLLVGIARPARPHPRRGLTVLALACVAVGLALSGGTALAVVAML